MYPCTINDTGAHDVRLLSIGFVKFLPNSISPQLVTFALLVDAIAQEGNETFSINLTPNPATPLPSSDLTIKGEMRGTILDADGEFYSKLVISFGERGQ